MYSPRSIKIHEADIPSVVSYDVELRILNAAVQDGTFPADPSGDTVVSISDLITAAVAAGHGMLGQEITIWVRETGPSGAQSDWQQAGFGTHIIVVLIPDGAESITITF